MLVAPEFFIDFRKVLLLLAQRLGQRPGTAGGLQVLGLVGMVTAFLAVHVDIDAVHASEEQHHCQDNHHCT